MTIPTDLIHGDAGLREARVEPPRVIDFLPYVFPPETMVPFDVVDSQTLNAGLTANIQIFGPTNMNAVLRWFGNEVTLDPGYPDIFWTFLIAGIPYQPYVLMQYSRGAIDNPDPILVRVAPNRVVTVQITNASGVSNWIVRTRVKGWFY